MGLYLSIDTGGTHTDIVLIDQDAHEVWTTKTPTTPEDLKQGVITGIRKVLADSGRKLSDVTRFVYGTTLVTNLIIEQAEMPVGLITTKNFRDILEIGRAYRNENIYDLAWQPPSPLVKRHSRFGIPERIDARGEIVEALDESETIAALNSLAEQGIESIAVCLLNAYVNPVHEQRIRDLAREHHPDIKVSLSSDIIREFREFERTSTTVVNAFVMLPLHEHLMGLEKTLIDDGLVTPPYIIRANGGIMTFGAARDMPIALTHSGPMGGIVGATSIAAASGHQNLITFDMGGTSSDVSLIANGKPTVTTKSQIAGYPVKLPTLDLATVGAGGGSIAWVDDAGALKVGPKSAGANPGPACYGLGGVNPTITDANLICGRLNPDYFLAGAEKLRFDLAESAVARLAEKIDLSVNEAALGILEIGEAHMINAIKLASVKRGLDPRGMALVAFGGAGPLHAARIAEELSVDQVIIPWAPGNLSALGMLDGDVQHDFVLSRISGLNDIDGDEIWSLLQDLIEDGARWLESEGVDAIQHRLIASVDLRYTGQSHELNLPLVSELGDETSVARLTEAFHQAHRQIYGYDMLESAVQLVNLRLSAVGVLASMSWPRSCGSDKPVRPQGERQVYMGGKSADLYATYRFEDLHAGSQISGPAIVEYTGSTLIMPPAWSGEVDEFRSIQMTKKTTNQGASI
jgi:N-methylhydantoinase A